MTGAEKQYIEKHILKLVTDNSKGVTIDTILEYLDYVNKVNYSHEDIMPILKQLIFESKISNTANLFILEK